MLARARPLFFRFFFGYVLSCRDLKRCGRIGSADRLGVALVGEQSNASAGVRVERGKVQLSALQRPVITTHTLWQNE